MSLYHNCKINNGRMLWTFSFGMLVFVSHMFVCLNTDTLGLRYSHCIGAQFCCFLPSVKSLESYSPFRELAHLLESLIIFWKKGIPISPPLKQAFTFMLILVNWGEKKFRMDSLMLICPKLILMVLKPAIYCCYNFCSLMYIIQTFFGSHTNLSGLWFTAFIANLKLEQSPYS